MRVTCPHCGERDRREFTVQGDDTSLRRPERDAGGEAWSDFVHLRDNPAGVIREMWYHDPCQAWLVVTRDTVTHAVLGTLPAREAARGATREAARDTTREAARDATREAARDTTREAARDATREAAR